MFMAYDCGFPRQMYAFILIIVYITIPRFNPTLFALKIIRFNFKNSFTEINEKSFNLLIIMYFFLITTTLYTSMITGSSFHISHFEQQW